MKQTIKNSKLDETAMLKKIYEASIASIQNGIKRNLKSVVLFRMEDCDRKVIMLEKGWNEVLCLALDFFLLQGNQQKSIECKNLLGSHKKMRIPVMSVFNKKIEKQDDPVLKKLKTILGRYAEIRSCGNKPIGDMVSVINGIDNLKKRKPLDYGNLLDNFYLKIDSLFERNFTANQRALIHFYFFGRYNNSTHIELSDEYSKLIPLNTVNDLHRALNRYN